jgi:hypothetical protein
MSKAARVALDAAPRHVFVDRARLALGRRAARTRRPRARHRPRTVDPDGYLIELAQGTGILWEMGRRSPARPAQPPDVALDWNPGGFY